jgi:hypothetical protein
MLLVLLTVHTLITDLSRECKRRFPRLVDNIDQYWVNTPCPSLWCSLSYNTMETLQISNFVTYVSLSFNLAAIIVTATIIIAAITGRV